MKKTMRPTGHLPIHSLLLVLLIFFLPSARLLGQNVPSAGLQLQAFIPVPTWTTSGATVASFDVLTFNRVTGVMYLADRVNFGATAIDTKTWTYLGTVVLPGCATNEACRPSGVLVVPDLQKLIVTDRDTRIFIYDLRVPGQGPVATLTGPPGQDELDYDPINQRAYIGNTTTDFSVTVVDVKNNRVLGSIAVSDSVEQPRFNPVDGLIYVTSPDALRVIVIDPQQGSFGAVINAFQTPNGCANGIDIDPVNDTAFLGCNTGPQVIMDLRNGAILQTFPITGADIVLFNSNNRRWYVGADNRRTAATVTFPCPKGSDGRTGVVAVFSNAPQANQLVGVACGGRGGIKAGVDPIQNNIYYPVVQYPPDANSANTGSPGILVFHDPAPPAQPVAGAAQGSQRIVTLASRGPSTATGSVNFIVQGRTMAVSASVQGLPTGIVPTALVITTTGGNEVVNCGVFGNGAAACGGNLVGDPLVGGLVDLSLGGQFVAQGRIP